MKSNVLKLLFMLITAITVSLFFGSLVGGGDNVLVGVACAVSFVSTLTLSYAYTPNDRKQMAFSACGAITAGINLNCEDPLASGVVATFYIANKDDIANISYDTANPMIADGITMKVGKVFYKFEGQLQSTEPKFAMIKGKYINQFEHSVSALVFKIDPSSKEQILNMKDGNFVCIIENNYVGTTGNCKYEIYGAGTGLKAEVLERNPNDTENLGAFKIELKTQEYAREGKPPVTFFDTDLATTDAAVLALWD